MQQYIVRRALLNIVVIFLVITALFVGLRATPGDFAINSAASQVTDVHTADEAAKLVRHDLGLDRPLLQQYGDFVGGFFRGDLGHSFATKRPVMAELKDRMAPSVELAILQILIAVVVFLIGWFGFSGLAKSLGSSNGGKTEAVVPVIPTLTPFGPAITHTLPHFPTLTPQPSDTPTETQTPPLVVVIANTPRPQASCGRPSGWVTYTIQPNDTLSQLGRAYGVSVAQLQNANCMGSSTILHVGKTLYVPPWAVIPVIPTLEPTLYIPGDTSVETPVETPTETLTEFPTATDVPAATP